MRALGLAATGAAAGPLLAETVASPAAAASAQAGAPADTPAAGGGVAPAVVVLTDEPAIGVDASLGNDFRVTIAGSRVMGNPANPTDGQKITFQITQGDGGPFTITWDSTYLFPASLPPPTLSTGQGQTDLAGFIYNAGMSAWLFAAAVTGFSSPATTLPAGTYRLFPTTTGPATPVSYSGPFLAGVLFQVTTGGMWLDGYWWWVCPTGQATDPQQFALWSVYNTGVGLLVPGSTVTSGPLTAGQWNFVPLPAPVPLAIGACYNACTGFHGSFPDTSGQYGANGPYSTGITNGPLTAFSDQSGTEPAPFSMSQGVFSAAGSDPTIDMPAAGSDSGNFWMDIQADTNPPAGATYRLWPGYPALPGVASGDTTSYTLATEFQLSQPCTLGNIWFYSAPGANILPSRCAIWDVGSQTEVAGTGNTSPAWSGGPGSGWVACPYTGVTLPAGDYKVAVFSDGGSPWFEVTTGYWGSGGPGASGITAGPLTAPGLANATSPGQGTYNPGAWAFPLTYAGAGNGENFWADIEVTPA